MSDDSYVSDSEPAITPASAKRNAATSRNALKKTKAALTATGTKTTRDVSFRQKFVLHYGHDEAFYQHCHHFKQLWQDKMFFVPEKIVLDDFGNGNLFSKHIPDQIVRPMPPPKLTLLSEDAMLSQFNLAHNAKRSFKLQYSDHLQSLSLGFGESFKLNDTLPRNGLLLNAGGHVVTSKWLPQNPKTNSDHAYLAVSVMNGTSSISETILDPKLSIFAQTSSTTSATLACGIQIWRYNLANNDMSLHKLYITTDTIGLTSDLRWLPGYESDSVLGILCGTFSDGKLHLIEISHTAEQEWALLLEPSVSYAAPAHKMTCFDFLGDTRIMIGMSNGNIREYLLPGSTTELNKSELDLQIPSFVQNVTEAPITSVLVCERDTNFFTIIVHSAGSQCFAIEYPYFQRGRMESWATNSLQPPIYNCNLKVFISDDAQDTLTYGYVRHPHEKSNLIMKVDGTLSAYHMSEVLSHPLVLSGNSLGEVHIINVARKVLNGGKTSNKVLQPLRLWKVTVEKSDEIQVSADLVVSPADKATNLSIAPPEVTILALAWNESLNASSLYCAATIGGLVIVERLDPTLR